MGLSMELAKDVAEAALAGFRASVSGLDLNDAATADLGRFPWQQNLRVLRHHLLRPLPNRSWWAATRRVLTRTPRMEPTRIVVVLPSPQSAPYATAFTEIASDCVARSCSLNVLFKIWPQAVDYNDLTALRREFLAIVRAMQENRESASALDEISIDTRPGMKLVSIAGAAVTFASPLEFTYVETAPPNRVVAFDVRAAFRIPIER